MAWQRKLLRVDLTAGTCVSRAAQHGVGAEVHRSARPGDQVPVRRNRPQGRCAVAGNKLIMATGPLTGTMAATGGRYSVITKSPLTGAIACSNSGGFIGAEMKAAGWDMIIFEGKSPKPVYLLLENDQAQLLSAEGCGASRCGRPTTSSTPLTRTRCCAWPASGAPPRKAACTPASSTTSIAPPAAPASAR
jgi:aldehyde:ferredoxin oxidoreductase